MILPAGYLVQMGFSIVWKKGQCVVKRRDRRPLEVKLVKGCPLVSREVGLQLLRDYEEALEKGELSAMKPVISGISQGVEGELPVTWYPPFKDSRRWLAERVRTGRLSWGEQLAWLKAVFPEAPDNYIQRAAGLDADPQELSSEGVPWNHRRRRSIMRSKSGEVLLHVFAGQQKWKGPGFIVEVEKSRGADLLGVGVFQHLLCWAVKGIVGEVVGGPPCRTASQCRSEEDGGPPPVRDRLSGRWGLPGLKGDLKDLVMEDSVLWMRYLLIYAVAQAFFDGDLGEDGEVTPCSYSDEPHLSGPPAAIKDPVELAKWALHQAARNLKWGSVASSRQCLPAKASIPNKTRSNRVFFVWEHPADPATYRRGSMGPKGGWASWWAFLEWKRLAEEYEIYEARFDQGKFHHPRPKPSVVATTSWFLFEELHQQVLTASERAAFDPLPKSVGARIQASSTWSRWAPGLSDRVHRAWCVWGEERGLWAEVQARKVLLAKLTEEEMQTLHERNDHIPYRKGCPVCISAQSCQRSHWRAAQTGMFSASCDLAGPFVLGKCFDPVASGRDKGLNYRYFLACAFTVPLPESRPGSELPGGDVPDKEVPEAGDRGPEMEPVDDMGLDSLFDALEKAVHVRIREKRPEPSFSGSFPKGPADAEPLEPPPLPPPAHPPVLRTRTLCIGTPLRSKRGKEVFGAVQVLLNKLEAHSFPVHRYHADRAQKLKSKALVAWLRDRGIHATWTPGDSLAGNKAELAVQQLKQSSRKLLAVAEIGPEFWPLAVLHASNRHWVEMCSSLGIKQPHLLPFGLRIHARQRTKTGYLSHWRSRTVDALYLGQAPHTPGGHLALVGEGADARVLLTNTVYLVGPGAVRDARPRYRIKGKTAPEFLVRVIQAVPVAWPKEKNLNLGLQIKVSLPRPRFQTIPQ